jgi:hypothetical protein
MAHFIPSAGVHRRGSFNSTTTAFCVLLKKKRRWAPGSLVVCARSQRHLRYEYHRHQSNRSTIVEDNIGGFIQQQSESCPA